MSNFQIPHFFGEKPYFFKGMLGLVQKCSAFSRSWPRSIWKSLYARADGSAKSVDDEADGPLDGAYGDDAVSLRGSFRCHWVSLHDMEMWKILLDLRVFAFDHQKTYQRAELL